MTSYETPSYRRWNPPQREWYQVVFHPPIGPGKFEARFGQDGETFTCNVSHDGTWTREDTGFLIANRFSGFGDLWYFTKL